MKIISKKTFLKEKEKYFDLFKKGKVFIYPTDTIYGLGCDALKEKAVEKIIRMKERKNKPMSIIAPNKEWIKENCILNKNAEKWMKKLPGKYTLIMNLKNKKSISNLVNQKHDVPPCFKTGTHALDAQDTCQVSRHNNQESLGVRIPKNWFAKILEEYSNPFVTTSVNLTGEKPMSSLKDLNNKVKRRVDYLIYEGKITGKPSTIVDLRNEEKVMKRD